MSEELIVFANGRFVLTYYGKSDDEDIFASSGSENIRTSLVPDRSRSGTQEGQDSFKSSLPLEYYHKSETGNMVFHHVSDFLQKKLEFFDEVTLVEGESAWIVSQPHHSSVSHVSHARIRLYWSKKKFEKALQMQSRLAVANLCPKLLDSWKNTFDVITDTKKETITEYFLVLEHHKDMQPEFLSPRNEIFEDKRSQLRQKIKNLELVCFQFHYTDMILTESGELLMIDFDHIRDKDKRKAQKKMIKNKNDALKESCLSSVSVLPGQLYDYEVYDFDPNSKICRPCRCIAIQQFIKSIDCSSNRAQKWQQFFLLFDYCVEHIDFVRHFPNLHRTIKRKLVELKAEADNKELLQKVLHYMEIFPNDM